MLSTKPGQVQYRWDNTGALAVLWGDKGLQRAPECRPDLSDAERREIDIDRLRRIDGRYSERGKLWC